MVDIYMVNMLASQIGLLTRGKCKCKGGMRTEDPRALITLLPCCKAAPPPAHQYPHEAARAQEKSLGAAHEEEAGGGPAML